MAPFVDMINHNSPRNANWGYSSSEKAFLVRAIDDIKKGDEVYFNYGSLPNYKYLNYYGFLMETNPIKVIPPVDIFIDENDPLL